MMGNDIRYDLVLKYSCLSKLFSPSKMMGEITYLKQSDMLANFEETRK